MKFDISALLTSSFNIRFVCCGYLLKEEDQFVQLSMTIECDCFTLFFGLKCGFFFF